MPQILGAKANPTSQFSGAKAKLTIANLADRLGDMFDVQAQYNPKELQVTYPYGWTEKASLNAQNSDGRVLEFGGVKSATMQVELLFDDVETHGTPAARPVMTSIDKLKKLASVQDPHSPDENLRRPHYCVVTWGERGMPAFRCVIESIAIKYLVFSSAGEVLRASVTVALKEADRVALAKNETKLAKNGGQKGARKTG